MNRIISFVHDNGTTAPKFQRAISTFAEARDFKLVSGENSDAIVTVVFVESSTMPSISASRIAICRLSDASGTSADNRIFYGGDVTVQNEASDLMRWLDGFWLALDGAGFPSRFPVRVSVCEGRASVQESSLRLYEGELVGHELLTHPDYPRPSYLLTIDYKDAPLEYETGDHVVIMPENRDANVDRLLKVLNADRNAVYTVTDSTTGEGYSAPLGEILKTRLSIQGLATRKFLATMALLADKEAEAAELNEMATNMAQDSPYARSIRNVFSFVDVLEKFTSLSLTVEQAIAAIPPMRPRMYSCSCSPLRAAHQVQLTFTLVTYPTADGSVFEGTNTSYMRSLKVGDKVRVTIKPGARDPTLNEPRMKYVGVALGSGVALLRGVAQHFHLAQLDSSLLLYYGVRHKLKDFMFQQEFEQYAQTGALDLQPAFSHDQEEFITPATLIKQDPERLCKVLVDEPQAKFFYCGPAGPAIKSILDAIKDAVERCRPNVSFEQLVAKMKEEKRWNAEAYTPAPDPENPFRI